MRGDRLTDAMLFYPLFVAWILCGAHQADALWCGDQALWRWPALAVCIGFAVLLRIAYCRREHDWRATRGNEVHEEQSICDRCGLYASEDAQPCRSR